MSGHKSFNVLSERIDADPERNARVEELKRSYEDVLALADLRESLGFTQAQLAESLGVSQPNVSKVEHEEDIHLSTLVKYISALGGRLEMKAVFPSQAAHLALPEESQREAVEKHSKEMPKAYWEFLNSVLSFYQETLGTAMQVAQGTTIQQAAQATQQGVQDTMEAVDQMVSQAEARQQAMEADNQATQQAAQETRRGSERASGGKTRK